MIKLAEFAERGTCILNKSVELKNQMKNFGMDISKIEIPENFSDGNKKISVVFAGQYSAGKSSILRMITGDKTIKIGEGIVTDKVTYYDWNGIEFIDTPGVKTKIHPEHDALALQAIAKADLLVFVITNELFDDLLGNDFRSMAFEPKNKAAEMMLIVNKMNRCGNNEEKQQILCKDIEKVTAPLMPDDFNVSFIDASDYMKSKDLNNKYAERYFARSGYNALIVKLDEFVHRKRIVQKLLTPANQLEKGLEDMLDLFNTKTGSNLVDGVILQLRSERKMWNDLKLNLHSIETNTRNSIGTLCNDHMVKILNTVKEGVDPKKLEMQIKNDFEEIEKLCNHQFEILYAKIQEQYDQFELEYKNFFASDSFVDLSKLYETECERQGGNNPLLNKEKLEFIGKNLGKVTNKGILQTRDLLRLPFKFKPHGAEKLAKFLGNFGKALAIAGTVLEAWLLYKDKKKEDEYIKVLNGVRGSVIKQYTDFKDSVYEEVGNYVDEIIKSQIDVQIKDVNDSIEEFNIQQNEKNKYIEENRELLQQVRILISDMRTFQREQMN